MKFFAQLLIFLVLIANLQIQVLCEKVEDEFQNQLIETKDHTNIEGGCGCSLPKTQKDIHGNLEDLGHSNTFILDATKPETLFDIQPPKEYDPNRMVFIPGGKFNVGTNKPFLPQDGEGPVRHVHVSDFLMDAYEVSNYAFAQFVTETNYKTEAEEIGWSFVFFDQVDRYKEQFKKTSTQESDSTEWKVEGLDWWIPVPAASWRFPYGPPPIQENEQYIIENDPSSLLSLVHHPVVHVSQNDANEYCKWRGKRLPTEIEWERAAKGGLEDRLYPWGNNLNPKGNHMANIFQGKFPLENTVEDGYRFTAPVYEFQQNQYGLYNIVGNVWEWTSTWWTTSHRNEPIDSHPSNEQQIVMKGGSFLCHQSYCYRYRVAARSKNLPNDSTSNLGFRCAKSLTDEERKEFEEREITHKSNLQRTDL